MSSRLQFAFEAMMLPTRLKDSEGNEDSGEPTPVSHGLGGVDYVRVKSVESTTTSARSRTMRLNLEAVDAPHDSSIEMSIGKLTPSDLTELALRTALFGDTNPLEDQHMGFFAELPDPLLPLRTARVSDEIVRPLAELLIVDGLVH
jgi:hypothetical protein